jgi:hypothetical protein
MTGFSQPERRALKRLQTAQAHPDADLLTAFSEQTLIGRERELVLAHLAACASCREVVSLAARPIPEPLASQSAPKPAFWKWPVLRWGAVAASAVIVVIAVSLGQYERKAEQLARFGSEMLPIAAPASQQKVQRDETLQQPPASPGVKAPQIRYEKVAPQPASKAAAKPRNNVGNDLAKDVKEDKGAPAPAALGGVAAGSGLAANNSAPRYESLRALATNRNAVMTPTTAAAPAAPPPTGLQAARSAPAPAEATSVRAETVTVESQASAMKPAPAIGGPMNVSRAKTAKSEQAAHGDAAQAFAPSRQLQYRNVISEWQVTPEGYLLNSTDQGRNWARQLPDQRFTHVQTVGPHVWATGPDGVLMHSADGGINWTRVTPSDKDVRLRGDIVSMVFLDANHGTLKTSSGETWSTADAGQSWRKQ